MATEKNNDYNNTCEDFSHPEWYYERFKFDISAF